MGHKEPSDLRDYDTVLKVCDLIFLSISKMAASTNAGIGKYGLVTSQRTLEAPPPAEDIALRLDSQTIDCLLLRWDPPQNRADDIHSYKVRESIMHFCLHELSLFSSIPQFLYPVLFSYTVCL